MKLVTGIGECLVCVFLGGVQNLREKKIPKNKHITVLGFLFLHGENTEGWWFFSDARVVGHRRIHLL